MTYDYAFKCAVVGAQGTGKTSISLQFTEKQFKLQHVSSVGIDLSVREIKIEGERIKLQVWDTIGQERFNCVARQCYRGAVIVLVVYDVTNAASFKSLPKLLKNIRDVASPKAAVMLVGNKIDLTDERRVKRSKGETFARENALKFMEVSAKSGHNVEEAFMITAEEVYEKLQAGVFNNADAENAIKLGPNHPHFGRDTSIRLGQNNNDDTLEIQDAPTEIKKKKWCC